MAITTTGGTTTVSGRSYAGFYIPAVTNVGDKITVSGTNCFLNGGSYASCFSTGSNIGLAVAATSGYYATPFYQFTTSTTTGTAINPSNLTLCSTDGLNTILFGNNSSTGTSIQYSSDGATTVSNTGAIPSGQWNLTFYNSAATQWIAVSTGGTTTQPAYSTNLANAWAASTGGTFTSAMQFGDVGGGLVVLGTGTTVNYSSNGTSYTNATAPVSFSDIRYANGLFYGFPTAASTSIYTSPTGATWTARTIPSSTTCTDIVYFNGTYFLATANGVYVSTDGVTFTTAIYSYNPPSQWKNSNTNLFLRANTNNKFLFSGTTGSQFNYGLSFNSAGYTQPSTTANSGGQVLWLATANAFVNIPQAGTAAQKFTVASLPGTGGLAGYPSAGITITPAPING